MRLRLDKPWQPLTAETRDAPAGPARRLPDRRRARAPSSIIGQAGARSPFGLRSELQRELAERGAGCQFRVEVNQQYRTRWFELLMVHQADHGSLPADNAKNPPPNLGRLSPA